MSTEKAISKFKDILHGVDDLSGFVTAIMREFDELKESGQRSEIEIGIENWINTDGEKF